MPILYHGHAVLLQYILIFMVTFLQTIQTSSTDEVFYFILTLRCLKYVALVLLQIIMDQRALMFVFL